MPDVEEDAEERRGHDEHHEPGRPREGKDGLQRVAANPRDFVLAADRAKRGRLVREGGLEDAERHREDEDDGEQRRERAVLGRAEHTADDDVEQVVRAVEQARTSSSRSDCRRNVCTAGEAARTHGGATPHPIILDKLTLPDAPKRGRHVRMSGGCAKVAVPDGSLFREPSPRRRRRMRPPAGRVWALLRSVVLPLVVSLICLRSLFRDGYLLQVDIVFGPRPGPCSRASAPRSACCRPQPWTCSAASRPGRSTPSERSSSPASRR